MENDEKCLSLNAGGSQRPSGGPDPQCGSQLSHNLKLSPNEARESSSRGVKGRKGGIFGARVLRLVRETYERATKKTKVRWDQGGPSESRTGASHKHPHNDPATNDPLDFFRGLSFCPFLFPRPHTACICAYFLETSSSSTSLSSSPSHFCTAEYARLSFSRRSILARFIFSLPFFLSRPRAAFSPRVLFLFARLFPASPFGPSENTRGAFFSGGPVTREHAAGPRAVELILIFG